MSREVLEVIPVGNELFNIKVMDQLYRKIPKISPSKYKPLKFEMQNTLL